LHRKLGAGSGVCYKISLLQQERLGCPCKVGLSGVCYKISLLLA